jgi:MerR family mercuric resistance operon transcriptional regulator
MAQPKRSYGRIRRYAFEDVSRFRFIKSAQRLGFMLGGVTALLQSEDGTHCDLARRLGEEKLADVQDKLAHLRRIESALAQLVRDRMVAEGKIRCPLITSLQKE